MAPSAHRAHSFGGLCAGQPLAHAAYPLSSLSRFCPRLPGSCQVFAGKVTVQGGAEHHRGSEASAASAYGISQLRQDLERFVFLLGGSDGEPLFGP